MFDVSKFKQGATQAAGSTFVRPIPVKEYPAIIEDYKLDTGNKDGRNWVAADIHYLLMDPVTAKEIGREKLTVRQRIFLDVTDSGDLDMSEGRNVNLNKLRDAVGQNVAGKIWGFDHLKGQQVKVKTKLREGNNGVPYAEVDYVGKA